MHRSGVIPCCWPWKLLERSGSSSLGGPEKVATVKVTSILLLPSSLFLSLPFVFFSFFSSCVDQRSRTHTTKYNGSRPLLARANLNSRPLYLPVHVHPPRDPAQLRSERKRNQDPKLEAVAVIFERSYSVSDTTSRL